MEHIQHLPIFAGSLQSPDELDDNALVELVRRTASPDGFRALVERYQSRVFRLMASTLGPALASEAEDATQEVFLHVYRKLGQFRFESSFSTWLYRVAYHKAIDHRRRLQRHRSEALSERELELRDEGPLASPLTASLSEERRRRVEASLSGLSEPTRTTLHLHYWLGSSVREIAEVLDMKEGTVKSHLFRGRRRLARELRSEAAT